MMNCPYCSGTVKQISCTYKKCKDCGEIFFGKVRGGDVKLVKLIKLIESSKNILNEAYDRHDGKILVGFSGGKDSSVLLDLSVKLFGRDIPVVFNDTKCEFPETYEFIERMVNRYDLIDFHKTEPMHSFFRELNYSRRARSPLQALASKRYCCWTLKKIPLMKYGNKRWGKLEWAGASGVKKSDSRQRKNYEPFMKIDNTRAEYFLCQPLVDWTDPYIEEYINRENLPVNPIYQWYDSTGCAPCPCPNKYYDYYSKLAKNHPKWYLSVWRHRKQDKIYYHSWLTEDEVMNLLH